MDNIKAILKMRYDTYENWFSTEKKEKVLEQGEIGFCLVEGENSENLKPGVYFKVGNNADTYETLPWFQTKAMDVPDYAKQTETLFIDWVNKSLLDTEYVVQKGVTEIKCPIDPQVVTEAEVEFIYNEEGENAELTYYLSVAGNIGVAIIPMEDIKSRYISFDWPGVNNYSLSADIEIDGKRVPLEGDGFGNSMIPIGNITGSLQIEIESLPYEYDGADYGADSLSSQQTLQFISAGDRKVSIYIEDYRDGRYALKEKWTLSKYQYSKVLRTEPEVHMNVTWKRISFKEAIFNEIFTTQEIEHNEEYSNDCSIDGNGTITVSSDGPMIVRWAVEKTPDLSWKAEDFIGTWKLTDTFFRNLVSTDFSSTSIKFYSNGKYYTNISCSDGSLYFGDDLVYYNNNIMNVNYQYITIGQSMEETITNDDFYVDIGYYLKEYGEKTTLQKTLSPGFYSFKENESYVQFANDMPEGEFHIKFKAKGELYDSTLKKTVSKYIGTQIYLDGTLIYPSIFGIDERILNFAILEAQSADYNVVTWFESKMTGQLYDSLTMDGRCSYKLYSTNVNCVTNGIKDAMYEGGLHFPATYGRPEKPSLDTFDIYITANKNKVYVLYEIADNNIISDSDMYYRNDCADIIISLDAQATGQELRLFGSREGDINTALYYINDSLGTATALKNFGISELCVKYTDIGYNVEFAIDRNKFALFNKFSFLGMATCATSASERVYPCTVNAYAWHGNQAKAALNEVIIMDAPALTDDGRFAYRLNAITSSSDRPTGRLYDYERKEAYKAGLKFTPTYNLVDDKNTFTVYLGATTFGADSGGGCLVVKYEVKDESIILASEASFWWNDCIDFILNTDGTASGGNEFRIEGRKETTSSNGIAHSLPNYVQEYTVTHTNDGYDVEFVIPRSALANYNNFSFMAFITAAISATSRKYPCIENASYKEAKNMLNYVTIIDDINLDSYSWGNNITSARSNIQPDTTKISISGNVTQGSVNLTFYDSLDNILSSYSLKDSFNSVEYFVPFGAERFSIQIIGATYWSVRARQLTSDPIIDSSLSNYEIISQNLYTADQNLINIPDGATKVMAVGTYNNYLNNNSVIKFIMVDNTSTEVITHNIKTITAAPTENYGINKIFSIPDAAVKCGFDATGDPATYDEAFKCNIEVTFLKEIIPISDAQIQGTWSLKDVSTQELGKGEYNLGFVAWNDLSNQWEEASALVKTEEDFTIRFRSGYISSNFANNVTIFDASTLSNYFKKWIVDNAVKVENETSSELIGLWEMRDDTTTTFGDMPIGSSIRVNFLHETDVRFYQDEAHAVYVGDTWVAQVGDYGGIGQFTLEVTDAQKLDDQFKTWFLSHFRQITTFTDLRGVWQCNGYLGDIFYDCQGSHSFEFISAGESFSSLSILEPFMGEPTIYYDTNIVDLNYSQYGVITINSLAKVSNSFVNAFKQAFTKISDIPNTQELGIAETNIVNSLSDISIVEHAIAVKLYGEITPAIAQVAVQCLNSEGGVLLSIPLTGTMDDPTYSELFFYLPESTKTIRFSSSAEPFACEVTVEQYKDYLYGTWQIVDVDGFIRALHNDRPMVDGTSKHYDVSFTWSKTDGSFTKECSTIGIRGGSYDTGGPVDLSWGSFGDTEVYSNIMSYSTILTDQDQITIHNITSGKDFIRSLLINYCFNMEYLKGEYYLDFHELEAAYANSYGYTNESIVFTVDGEQYDSISYYREGGVPEGYPSFAISYGGKTVYKYYDSGYSEEEPNMGYINIISYSQVSSYLLRSLTKQRAANAQYRSMFNLRRNAENEITIQPEGELIILPSSPKKLIPILPLKYNFGTIGYGNVFFNATYTVEEKVNKADFVEAQLRKEIGNLMEMIEELRAEIEALKNTKTEVELVTWNSED